MRFFMAEESVQHTLMWMPNSAIPLCCQAHQVNPNAAVTMAPSSHRKP